MPTVSRRVPDQNSDTEPKGRWPVAWRVMESPPASGTDNMALDLALLHAAASGQCVLRTYGWTRPTVSFGRNERVHGVWNVEAMRVAGLDVVRRPTGGRALLHTREVTYSVTMPWSVNLPWRDAYDAVNHRLLQALVLLGVPARLHPGGALPAVAPDGPICFASPSAGEVVTDGGKVAGSAVWRSGSGYLQHGSILLYDDQALLASYRCNDSAPDVACTAPLSTWLHDPSDSALTTRVIAALRSAWCCDARDTDLSASSAVDEHTLAECRVMMMSPNWLWRR